MPRVLVVLVEGVLVDEDQVQRHIEVVVVEWAVQVAGERTSREGDGPFMAGEKQLAGGGQLGPVCPRAVLELEVDHVGHLWTVGGLGGPNTQRARQRDGHRGQQATQDQRVARLEHDASSKKRE